MILNKLALVLAIALSSQTVLADEKLRGRVDNVRIGVEDKASLHRSLGVGCTSSPCTTEFGVATGYCNNQNECVPGADCSDEGASCDSGFGQGSLSGICNSGVCVDSLCAAVLSNGTLDCTSGSVVCRSSTGYCVSFSGAAQCHYPLDINQNGNTCSAEGGLAGTCDDGFCENGPISIPGCRYEASKTSWTKDGINYVDCDDDNECTTDTCNSELGCFHDISIREDEGCSDGEECTSGDKCDAYGSCIDGGGPQPVACWPEPGSFPPYSKSDFCTARRCCTLPSCQLYPLRIDPRATCCRDPFRFYTGDEDYPTNNITCDDDSLCTFDDECQNGECVGTPVNCDDDNPCTNDSCNQFLGCVNIPNVDVCEADENVCTEDKCGAVTSGECGFFKDKDCSDGVFCTDDTCDPPDNGCVNTPNDANCVDDLNPCTKPVKCDQTMGCIFENEPAGTACDDGDPCTLSDTCDGLGNCSSGSEQVCEDDGQSCTTNHRCEAGNLNADPVTGCTYDLDDTKCDIATPFSCTNNKCDPTGFSGFTPDANGCIIAPIDSLCDDGNSCTDDTCDPDNGNAITGCLFTPNDSNSCSDDNLCTEDTCVGGTCIFDTVVCDDLNSCTDLTSCIPSLGCTHESSGGLNGQSCIDVNDLCNVDATCNDDVCAGTPKDCDDGNPCTNDTCEPSTGLCKNEFNTDPCDDNNECTVEDTCTNGVCSGETQTIACAEGNGCFPSGASCNPDTGECIPTTIRECLHNGNYCDSDNNYCCHAGTCYPDPCPSYDNCGNGKKCAGFESKDGYQCISFNSFDSSKHVCKDPDNCRSRIFGL